MLRQQQRVPDRNIGSGETVRTKECMLRQEWLQRAQPREEPLAVVVRDLGLASLASFEVQIP